MSSHDPKFDAPEFVTNRSGCSRGLAVGESAWASVWTVIAAEGTRTETRYACDACHEWDEETAKPATYGMCLACHSVEVALNKVTGTRDLSYMGEHPNYPTGFGCEVCA